MRKRLKRLIQRYARARIAEAWIGAADPADHAEIRKELSEAYRALDAALKEVEAQLKGSMVPRAVEDAL